MRRLLTERRRYVLRWFVEHELALSEEIAADLAIPTEVVEPVCRELEAEGLIAPAVSQ